jgi:hypothetical protein
LIAKTVYTAFSSLPIPSSLAGQAIKANLLFFQHQFHIGKRDTCNEIVRLM